MSTKRRDAYQAAARWYDPLIEPLIGKLKPFTLRFARPEPGAVVLDVGCGTGTLLELWLDAGCEAWGLDASPAMLAVARQRLGARAQLREGDATAMPLPDERFDWVMFSFVLHEMPPHVRLAVLAEAKRVLRPEGRILVVDYHTEPRRSVKGWAYKGLITAVERFAGGSHWAGYRHFMAHGAMDGLAAEAGLQLERQRLVGHGNGAITVLQASPAG